MGYTVSRGNRVESTAISSRDAHLDRELHAKLRGDFNALALQPRVRHNP